MKIEIYFVLNKYLLSIFGVDDFKDLQIKLSSSKEGVDNNGQTYFLNSLLSLEGLKIKEDDLIRYDKNIQEYVKKISYGRGQISLKYFQYLAVLFSEIYLDYLKNKKLEFIYELNKFLENYDDEDVKKLINTFTEEDLKKLAFYMATGSGKTLIAHINYYQFFKYKLFNPDNIIFITPNKGLSKQHFEELQKSGIPAKLYSGTLNNEFKNENEVLVIEITKFVEEKKGGGLRLPVDVFEGKNLVFVDEGHKGRKSEEQTWAKLRDKISENGFVFEYSATFGQVLSEKNKETLRDYSKAILFDYSYKYFYLDGYGKDFWVLNIKETKLSKEKFFENVFVANILDFYQQMILYKEKAHLAKQCNIEKPLWIFVGTTVTKNEKENPEIISDVIKIVEFINKVINEKDFLIEKINSILEGKSSLKDEDDNDIFKNRFNLLKERGINLEDIYRFIFNGVGALKIYEIKNSEGEFGLKLSDNPYFGAINIGNASEFKRLLEQKGFNIEQDVISSSLFDDIKKESSSINILIGAKKFIEGWDTWRVSSMGLLHIGKTEGPQIIQLFGRGVRLRGKNMTLKRSNTKEIKSLETLNIYGIDADYIKIFLEKITQEIDLEEIRIPVKIMDKTRWSDLPYLAKNESKKYEEEVTINLFLDDKIYFTLDLIPKISGFVGERSEKGGETPVEILVKTNIVPKSIYDVVDINLLNWQKIFNEILEYKNIRGFWNLYFDTNSLKEILNNCRIKALDEYLSIKSKDDLERIEEVTILLLKGYIDKFYRKYKGKFETENMTYKNTEELLPFFTSEKFELYTVYIDKEKRILIDEIKKLKENIDELLKDDNKILPRVIIDNSIYIPLLLKSKEIDQMSPPGLVESEEKFVRGLKEFLNNNQNIFSQYEIVLLRNEAKSGIGFRLESSNFYPDFILWVKDKNNSKTSIIFVDPKGLLFTHKLNDEKIKDTPKILKDVENNLKQNIYLYSFILSETSYNKLIEGESISMSKEEYENNNVLFLDDKDWCIKLFKKLS